MRSLIVESNPSGHRLWYVRLLVDGALERGHRVTLAVTPKVRESPEFVLHLSDVLHQVEVVETDQLRRRRELSALSRELSPHLILVPDGDRLAAELGASSSWSGPGLLRILVMRDPTWESPSGARDRIKIMTKRALLRRAMRFSNVEIVWLRGPGYQDSLGQYVNDPVSTPATHDMAVAVRDGHNMDSSRTWFGIVGGISERKNVSLVLEAVSLLPSSKVGLVLMGVLANECKEAVSKKIAHLESLGFEVRTSFSAMSDMEMNSVVRALDGVLIAYSTHCPPSTLGKALRVGTHPVVAGSAQLRSYGHPFGLRSSTNLVATQIAGAISELIGSPRRVPIILDSSQFVDRMVRET